ncbi:MAG: response regulator [Deferribacterales bacterium]
MYHTSKNNDEKTIFRLKLYRLLHPIYEYMRSKGVRQLHFHSKDSSSIIRMHAPEKFGDSLVKERPDVYLANQKLMVVRNFEIGKVYTGFRNVYLMIYGTEHLGSVEISFPFEQVRSDIIKSNPWYDYLAIIKKSELFKKFDIYQSIYRETFFSSEWLVEDTSETLQDNLKPLDDDTVKFLNYIKTKKKLDKVLNRLETTTIYDRFNGKYYSLTYYPLKDTNNKVVAAFLSVSLSPQLSLIHKKYYFEIIISLIIIFIISLLIIKIHNNYKKIKDQQTFIETILNTINSSIYIIDNSGKAVYLNQTFKKVMGYDESDLKDTTPHELFHVHPLKPEYCPLFNVITKKIDFEGLEVFRTKDGKEIFVDVVSKPIILNDRKLAVVSFLDITEEFNAKMKLEENLFILETVINNTPNGIILTDKYNKIVLVNDNIYQFFGFELKSDLKDHSRFFINLSARFSDSEQINKLLNGQNIEITATTIYNRIYRIEKVVAINLSTYFNLYIFIDITELSNKIKLLNELHIKAQEAVKAKSMFLSIMSHEIRTPLTSILGASEILKNEYLPEDAKQYLNIIKDSSQHLLTLINDILDFSKIESGDFTLQSIPFKPHDIFVKVSNILNPIASNKNLDILNFSKIADLCVLGDPLRFGQIIMNIMSNSVKYTNKGSVQIYAQTTEEDDKSVTVSIKIKDTGIGISEDKLPTIFEPFKTADINAQAKSGGTGLGLTITKKLIEMMNGEITIDSRVGQGTEVKLTFRFQKADPEICKRQHLNIESKDQVFNLNDLTVLVVEDNRVNAMLFSKMLNNLGINSIDNAYNGIEAIEKVKMNRYDLIFMDVQMPEMDGVTATKMIRSFDNIPNKDIIIVALTADTFEENIDSCLNAGMNYFLSKPINIDELKKILYLVLQNKTKGS